MIRNWKAPTTFLRLNLLALTAACLLAQTNDPLATLRQQHPRLIALESDIARIRNLAATDPVVKESYNRLCRQADQLLTRPPVEYVLIGPRLLETSRTVVDRIYTLGLVYRVSGDKKYFNRALQELNAVVAFKDWHPAHFLDTAEMTHAVAIGYDWLYTDLTPEDRKRIRTAIVEKGLDAALLAYRSHKGWPTGHTNWNQVCNGGIAIGALAVAEDEPKKAREMLSDSIGSIQLAMASYAPDGGWEEGPGYWHYATRYTVYYLSALESALGSTFGLTKLSGFDQAGAFRVYFESPAGGTFNYADAKSEFDRAPEMFWLAREFSNPVYAWDEIGKMARIKGSATDLIWYQPKQQNPAEAKWPLSRVFSGVNAAFLRSDWLDPKAFWIGIKGGDNGGSNMSHNHLDLGSFVMEAKGVRWAEDLGYDDYNIPGYFGELRYTYYRVRTESHNTILIDNENQDPKAKATLTGEGNSVTIDLSSAYPGKLRREIRDVALESGNRFLIRDRIEAAGAPVEALWGMVTLAEVNAHGNRVELKRNGEVLHGRILQPENAVFDIVSANPEPPQDPNKGAKKLVVRLPGKVATARIDVAFED
jgi:hypothetical protein